MCVSQTLSFVVCVCVCVCLFFWFWWLSLCERYTFLLLLLFFFSFLSFLLSTLQRFSSEPPGPSATQLLHSCFWPVASFFSEDPKKMSFIPSLSSPSYLTKSCNLAWVSQQRGWLEWTLFISTSVKKCLCKFVCLFLLVVQTTSIFLLQFLVCQNWLLALIILLILDDSNCTQEKFFRLTLTLQHWLLNNNILWCCCCLLYVNLICGLYLWLFASNCMCRTTELLFVEILIFVTRFGYSLQQ